mmetsp:Transcript_28569/g.73323  ORF Transcript_28569/g.73323 Transcript_28569/m.73323 type:complete len:140 (-) Transcript_28569:710-1129(-)
MEGWSPGVAAGVAVVVTVGGGVAGAVAPVEGVGGAGLDGAVVVGVGVLGVEVVGVVVSVLSRPTARLPVHMPVATSQSPPAMGQLPTPHRSWLQSAPTNGMSQWQRPPSHRPLPLQSDGHESAVQVAALSGQGPSTPAR